MMVSLQEGSRAAEAKHSGVQQRAKVKMTEKPI